jgi:DNA-binding winged helix-turn-helix (wHTH) protein
MNNVKSLPLIARFGAFEVSFESREICKHGMRIQLEEKPFQILEALIENAGQVVRRQALCAKLWPDTYVSFDHSLNTAVNKLRSVLGDGAQSPRYIETRPRMGYRFVAPVERVNGGAPVAVRAATASASAGQSSVAPQAQAHRVVMASSVQGSSRPQ